MKSIPSPGTKKSRYLLYILLQRIGPRSILGAGTVIFILTLAIRLPLALWNHPDTVSGSETINCVLSVVEKGTYAGTFGDNSGPSAHCLPLHILMQAGILKITGSGEFGAISLIILSCVEMALGFALLPYLCTLFGFDIKTGILAGFIGGLLPINYWAQTSGESEAPLTFLMLIIATCLVAGPWNSHKLISKSRAIWIGGFMGLSSLASSSLIPVFLLWTIFGLFQFRSNIIPYLKVVTILAIMFVSVLLPWAIRNKLVLGEAIWTRSNFGLELHVSNNEQAEAYLEANRPKYQLIHPLTDKDQRDEMKKLGEVQYNKQKRETALRWIASNTTAFITLTLKRAFYFWFIPYTRTLQTIASAILTLAGLLGFVIIIKERHPCRLLFIGIFVGYPAIYSIVQASARYRLPIEWLLLLLGSYAFFSLVQNQNPFDWRRHERASCAPSD